LTPPQHAAGVDSHRGTTTTTNGMGNDYRGSLTIATTVPGALTSPGGAPPRSPLLAQPRPAFGNTITTPPHATSATPSPPPPPQGGKSDSIPLLNSSHTNPNSTNNSHRSSPTGGATAPTTVYQTTNIPGVPL
jgi:hypothetical protein